MNMANDSDSMKLLAGYPGSWYSRCNIIALVMGMDTEDEAFGQKLAEGFRFFSEKEGPYLIHCTYGKDRTGFASAVLECLMGASLEEVVADYIATYENLFGVEQGTEESAYYAEMICKPLQSAFCVDALDAPGVDLSERAGQYLLQIGMTSDEISALKEKLSQDYGGLIADSAGLPSAA